MIRKLLLITMDVDGTEEQATCVCDAMGLALARDIRGIITPVAFSEGVSVSFSVDRLKCPAAENTAMKEVKPS